MIHILGIAGTFMAGIATLAKDAGISVSGSDAQVYPPMSTLLESLNIDITEGYDQTQVLQDKQIVVGNAMSRGNASVEYMLDNKLPYTSGPQWLHENVLRDKTVIAVAGTHGKTTVSSLLAWILQACDQAPGFLIGGKPGNFDHSARLGKGELFVVEADEYDTAFFDKRSKFVHYHPKIAILNNLEFDHADIFDDIEAIKTQFHHLVRTIPQNGMIIVNADEPYLADVISAGCWTPCEYFSTINNKADWFARAINATASEFEVTYKNTSVCVSWQGLGEHNMANALSAIAAATHAGVELNKACQALSSFIFPNKRLQQHKTTSGYILFEDFAHHPTAIAKTVSSLRNAYPDKRLIALLELRSNTMQMGIHKATLSPALAQADIACLVTHSSAGSLDVYHDHPDLRQFDESSVCLDEVKALLTADDMVIVMSNSNFDGMIESLIRL